MIVIEWPVSLSNLRHHFTIVPLPVYFATLLVTMSLTRLISIADNKSHIKVVVRCIESSMSSC